MKIERLNDDSIKVILCESDLADMNINPKSITPDSPEVSLILAKIVSDVSIRTGIYIDEGQIMVSDGEDGCVEIFIKRAHYALRDNKAADMHSRYRHRLVFEVSGFDELCMMLVSISKKYLKRMRIYQYNSAFYLSVPRLPVPLAVCEFSRKCRKNRIGEAVLSEHGRLIAQNEQVVHMAREIKKII